MVCSSRKIKSGLILQNRRSMINIEDYDLTMQERLYAVILAGTAEQNEELREQIRALVTKDDPITVDGSLLASLLDEQMEFYRQQFVKWNPKFPDHIYMKKLWLTSVVPGKEFVKTIRPNFVELLWDIAYSE